MRRVVLDFEGCVFTLLYSTWMEDRKIDRERERKIER